MLQRLIKYLQNNYLAILAIIALTFLVWHKILSQVLLGEGYMYFVPQRDFFTPQTFNNLSFFREDDNFARIMFDIFPPIFKDNITAYLLIEILTWCGLYLSLYFIVTFITKSRMIGFLSTVFFLANYIGDFYLFADGNYQRFVQRVPGFIPAIFSFYFLYRFFKEKRFKFYLLSILIFALAVALGHFTSMILPLFLIYPFIKLIDQKKGLPNFFYSSLIVISFLVVDYLLTKGSDQTPTRGILVFLLTEPNLLERVFYQIPLITIPLGIVLTIARSFGPKPLTEPYTQLMPLLTAICLILYTFGGLWVYKKRRYLFTIYLTSFLAMIGSMLLYIYIDVRVNPLKYYGADRFYLVPTLLATICWGIFLGVLFVKNRLREKIILSLILAIFVFHNGSLIWTKIDSIQYQSVMMKSFILLMKRESNHFNKNSIIVVPSYLQWPIPVIQLYILPKGADIISEFDGWENKYWSNKENLYVYDYSFDKGVDRTLYPYAGHIVDFSENYRRGEKIQFLN